MWKPAFLVALSIFLTCTLFFVMYGLAYVLIIKSIDILRKIRKKIENKDNDHRGLSKNKTFDR